MGAPNITKSVADNGSVTVILSGTVSIEASAELHRVLNDSLLETQRVVLDMQQLKNMDAATVQVICSACRSAVLRKSILVGEKALPAELVSLCGDMGILQGAPCNQNINESCVWLAGGK